MSLGLFWYEGYLTLTAAYESGLVVVARFGRNETWDILYRTQVHNHPVLSLDVAPHRGFFLTSGAEAIIAKHPIPAATTLPSQEPQHPRQTDNRDTTTANSSPLSVSLPSEPKQPGPVIETQPLKTIDTKHSGQQGLRIRSDGKIFATAGWDSKVRIYSTKTMSELAVLKWHEVGCYTVAFATLDGGQAPDPVEPSTSRAEASERSENRAVGTETAGNEEATVVAVHTKLGQLNVKDRRIKMVKEAHWLAAGSKDGKISLWDIY